MFGMGAALLAFAIPLVSPAPGWPSIDDDVVSVGGGEGDAAVIVGIDEYTYLPSVPGAAKNATAWQQWLLRVRRTPTQRVVTLRDSEATRERILRGLGSARDAVAKGGTLWVVFIGHGAPAPAQADGLVLGVDTQADADSLAARGILQRDIAAAVEGGAQSETIIVFDACFSGRTSDGGSSLIAGLQATLPVRSRGSTTATLLASSDTFAGSLPGGGRPAFSYILLGSLRGWADEDGDGRITVDDAMNFTTATMQAALRSDARLPSQRGTPSRLALNTSDRTFDVGAVVTGRCPDETRWDGRQCKARCPAGAAWSGSACISQIVSCPAAMVWNGTSCAPAIECPAHTVFNAGSCVASTISCPTGSRWDGVACRARTVALAPGGPDRPAAVEPLIETPGELAPPLTLPRDPVAADTTVNPRRTLEPTANKSFPWLMAGSGTGVALAVTGVAVSAYLLFGASAVLDSATTGRDAKDAAVTTQYVAGTSLALAGALGVAGVATFAFTLLDPNESSKAIPSPSSL